MTDKKDIFIIFSLLILLTGCAPKEFISLPENLQAEIGSTEAYIAECQKEMRADVETSNIAATTGGGLIPALIDCAIMSYREDCANEALLSVQDELKSFNLQEIFKNKFEDILRNTEWLNLHQVNEVKDFKGETQEEILKKVKTDVILTAELKYKLNTDFNTLTGTLYLTLYPASAKIKDSVKTEDVFNTPIFKFNVSAIVSLPHQQEDMHERVKRWAQDNGAYLKQSLETIVDQLCFSASRVLKNPRCLPEER